MSSSLPFPPPPGPPPSGSPPPGPPPPPPPLHPPDPASSNYFFGFVITFIVLLLLFIGCGVGSWRRFRQVTNTIDVQRTSQGRKRRRPVRPAFLEAWTQTAHTQTTESACKTESKWTGVQPISVAFVWSRSALRGCPLKTSPSSHVGVIRGGSLIFPWRPRRAVPPKPPPVERPPPEAIQVAVMIAMPSRLPSDPETEDGARYVGHAEVGEYQIGVVRIPWPSPLGDGT